MVILLYVSSFFINQADIHCPDMFFLDKLFPEGNILGHTSFSAFLAAVLMIVTAISIYGIRNGFTKESNVSIPFLFLLLVLSNPCSVYLTPYHIAAPLFAWSFYFIVKYTSAKSTIKSLYISVTLLFLASIFFPPLIWFALVILLFGLSSSDNKLHYVSTFTVALILPFVILIALRYITEGADSAFALPGEMFDKITTIPERSYRFPIAVLCKYIAVTVISITALFRIMRRMGTFRIIKSTLYSLTIVTLVFLTLILVIFVPDIRQPSGMIETCMLSLILYEALVGETNSTWKLVVPTIITGILLAERISYFTFLS